MVCIRRLADWYYYSAQKQTRPALYWFAKEDLGDNGSYTGNWFISGKTSREKSKFQKSWGQGRKHTAQPGTGGGIMERTV